jgi:hypothetical protein
LAGYEPFVLLPAAGTWFAELRKDAADRVDMKFFSIDDPLAATQAAREIRRSEFEKALEPLPLSGLAGDAGASLRSSLGALGAGPWLVRLRSGTGEDRWYLSSGRAEDATNAYAWNLSGGTPTILALAPDGRLAIADGRGAPTLISIPAPQEGATFTALAAIDGIAAAAWECGSFPYISSAGLVLHSLR